MVDVDIMEPHKGIIESISNGTSALVYMLMIFGSEGLRYLVIWNLENRCGFTW